jgi:hypothetical protein
VDLTVVSPFMGLMIGDFTVGQATLKIVSNKMAKYERACSDNRRDDNWTHTHNRYDKNQCFGCRHRYE